MWASGKRWSVPFLATPVKTNSKPPMARGVRLLLGGLCECVWHSLLTVWVKKRGQWPTPPSFPLKWSSRRTSSLLFPLSVPLPLLFQSALLHLIPSAVIPEMVQIAAAAELPTIKHPQTRRSAGSGGWATPSIQFSANFYT